MSEDEKILVKEIPVKDRVYNIKGEGIDKEAAEKLQQELIEAEKAEGEYIVKTKLSDDVEIESIIYNNGKADVTDTDRKMKAYEDENKLLKTRLDDSNSKIDSLSTQISEIANKLNQPAPVEDKKPVETPEVQTPTVETPVEVTPPKEEPKPSEGNDEDKNSEGTEDNESTNEGEGSDGTKE